MTFSPYKREELETIIKARLTGLHIYNPDAIEMLARKVSSLSGDVRRALQLCRRATELCERESVLSSDIKESKEGKQGKETKEEVKLPKSGQKRKASEMESNNDSNSNSSSSSSSSTGNGESAKRRRTGMQSCSFLLYISV